MFKHPSWWRWSFRLGSPLCALISAAAPLLWYTLLDPLAGLAALAAPAICFPCLWWTARNVPREISVNGDRVVAKLYFGGTMTAAWSNLETIQTFDVLGFTRRRKAVLLSFGDSELAFFGDLDRFEELSGLAAGHARSVLPAPPWWKRLLKLGTV